MNETQRVLVDAISHALSLGVSPEQASAVVQYLNDNGFDLVPVTIIGGSGWTPEEHWAYQAGVMWARHERRGDIAFPFTDEDEDE